MSAPTPEMKEAWPGISDAMKWILAAMETCDPDEDGFDCLERTYVRLKSRARYLMSCGLDEG